MGVAMKRIEIKSTKLMHFPEHDPPGSTEKDMQRSELQRHIAEYLANGGVITDVGADSGMHYPPRRTRRAQINFIKRWDYGKRKSAENADK